MVGSETKDVIVQGNTQAIDGSPHERSQKHKIEDCETATEGGTLHNHEVVLCASAQNNLARLATPIVALAIDHIAVDLLDGNEFGQHILASDMLMIEAVIATKIVVRTLDIHQAMDDKVVLIEKHVHLAFDALLIGGQRTKADFVATTIDKRQHADTAKQHGNCLAGFEPLAHLHEDEVVSTIRQCQVQRSHTKDLFLLTKNRIMAGPGCGLVGQAFQMIDRHLEENLRKHIDHHVQELLVLGQSRWERGLDG